MTKRKAPRRHWTVALTGGIAAGKSVVGNAFAARGIRVYDADVAARDAVAPGTAGLAAIVTAFGADMLDAAGQLDRRALRAVVFGDKAARRRLEAIVHPRVNEWLRARVAADRGPYCVLAIPLIAETWPRYAWVDRVLLVEAPAPERRTRLMQRDDMDEAAAQRMLDAQASDAARRARADDVLVNTGDFAALDAAVAGLHKRYLAMAGRTG